MKKLILGLPLLLISCQPCVYADLDSTANALNAETAVKCLLGEYESAEKVEYLTATAEAMRNRIALMGDKALKGVYGCKAVNESGGVFRRGKRIIPSYAVKRAFKAWEASKTSNLTKNGTHWEAVETFGSPYWAKSMVKTAKVGGHTYFRAISR
jgi:hypothetical protein